MDCFYITMEIAIRERLIEAAKWVNKLKNGQDCISFFVEPKQKNIIIVATHHDKKYLETIEFDPLTMRKPFSFAIPANYFIECNPQLDQTLPLVLKTQKTVNNCTVDLMGIDKLREYVTLSASQEHIDYRAMLSMLKINTVKKSTFDRLLYEINTYQPIEFVEVNAQQHEMKIQRDNNVVNYALPDSLGLSFNLALNNDAFKRLKAICDNKALFHFNVVHHMRIAKSA